MPTVQACRTKLSLARIGLRLNGLWAVMAQLTVTLMYLQFPCLQLGSCPL